MDRSRRRRPWLRPRGTGRRAELAGAFGVHANQITKWKRQLLDGVPRIFSEGPGEDLRRQEALTDRLYQQIGQLKVELDWLKKKSGLDA